MDWTPPYPPEARSRFRRAVVAAYVCFGANLVASAAAALILRHGSDLVPEAERMRYVVEHARDWRIAWATWMAAAPSLVVFYAFFAATLSRDMLLVRVAAVMIAATGMGFDLTAEYIFAVLIPERFAASDPAPELWGTATLMTGGIANGLYVTAGAMLTIAAALTPGFPRRLAWAAAPAWTCGALLTVASLVRHPAFIAVAMAATMVFFLAWLALIVRALWVRATQSESS